MKTVKIIRKRILINHLIYRRYFLDENDQPVGIPSGIRFTITPYANKDYVAICLTYRKEEGVPGSTVYADSFARQCTEFKKAIAEFVSNSKNASSVYNKGINRKRTPRNYAGIETPDDISFAKKNWMAR